TTFRSDGNPQTAEHTPLLEKIGRTGLADAQAACQSRCCAVRAPPPTPRRASPIRQPTDHTAAFRRGFFQVFHGLVEDRLGPGNARLQAGLQALDLGHRDRSVVEIAAFGCRYVAP